MTTWSCQVRTSYLQSSNVPTKAPHMVMYVMTSLFKIPLCQTWNKAINTRRAACTKQVPDIRNRPHYIILLWTEKDGHVSLICKINFWMDSTNIQCFISILNKQQDWKSEPLILCSTIIWSKDITNAFCKHSATVSWLDIKSTAIIHVKTVLTLTCMTQADEQTFHKNIVCSKLQSDLCPQTWKSPDPDQIFLQLFIYLRMKAKNNTFRIRDQVSSGILCSTQW
jgi:hypothetical protein